MNRKVIVIGGGAWGTALALTSHRAGNKTSLYIRDREKAEKVRETRVNEIYLPDITLPREIEIISELEELEDDLLILAIPSKEILSFAEQIKGRVKGAVLICTKGINYLKEELLSESLEHFFPNIGILSGPNFAHEIARNLPSITTIAHRDYQIACHLSNMLRHKYFTPYPSDDIIATQLTGAYKNIIAIACGMGNGMGLGENAVAAIITIALSELERVVLAFGGRASSIFAPAGIGDIILSCTTISSRNYRFGKDFVSKREIERGKTIEGYVASKAIYHLAYKRGVEIPLCELIYNILYNNFEPTMLENIFYAGQEFKKLSNIV